MKIIKSNCRVYLLRVSQKSKKNSQNTFQYSNQITTFLKKYIYKKSYMQQPSLTFYTTKKQLNKNLSCENNKNNNKM